MENDRQNRLREILKAAQKNVERGEELSAEWARELFPPERREYELVYYGKESEEKILADTMAVPLQATSTFGAQGNGWHNKLIFGDNLQAMKTLLQMKESGEIVSTDGTPGVKLIYIVVTSFFPCSLGLVKLSVSTYPAALISPDSRS